jgi:hypothetical protein
VNSYDLGKNDLGVTMKPLYFSALTALYLVFCASTSSAASFEGAGLRTCAEFESDTKNDPNKAEDFYFSWSEGFMSGLNIAQQNDKPHGFLSMPTKEQEEHIKTFCGANADAKFFKAVLDLYTIIYPKSDDR